MIDLTINEEQLVRTAERARERNIVIPTYRQQKDPTLVPDKMKEQLRDVGLWDVDSRNLFRITWKNEPVAKGGLYNGVNWLEIPSAITGVEARIIALVGKWFPTGSHKVGATFGCLVPRLVTGQFDPTRDKAVWPSTGNYCRGGAYDSGLLACESIAILPEEMSKERFDWLSTVAGEVIATPGCESNVKEIYDKCWELRETREDVVIFNQFDEYGNHLWHYKVTGNAMKEVLDEIMSPADRCSGVVLTSGSSGTMGCADFVKDHFPTCKIAVGEALQCPTLLLNGYGGHGIEGIGDKHVPWIHNVRNTDMVIALDDDCCLNLIRLFNEPEGQAYLASQGLDQEFIEKLPLLGISSVANMLGAMKLAKYYELGRNDIILTVFTDSMELYQSRLRELTEAHGEYSKSDAVSDYHRYLMGAAIDNMLELSFYDRKRIHNLKYFTWIEQQKKDLDELNAQWYDCADHWKRVHQQVDEIDELIVAFNERVGLI